MSQNTTTFPYLIKFNESVKGDQITDSDLGLEIEPKVENVGTYATVENPTQIFTKRKNISQESIKNETDDLNMKVDPKDCVFKIVYPQEFHLTPVTNIKRGRPKQKKMKNFNQDVVDNQKIPEKVQKSTRTRSGRLVKLPKYIESDFKKIEITTDEQDLQVSDFKRFEEKENTTKLQFTELQVKKRNIAAQYRCPKCSKAYLGKNKMIQHLKKYPDHGPLPDGYQEFNFDVWNYLYEVTQKSKAGQRGLKFCEELSNLLHNVQLLKTALFKTVTDNNKNCCVEVDKVLGNAIGLSPGQYKFDENELYKDVTVLKLITNNDFFKPNNPQPSQEKIVQKIDNKMDDLRENDNKKFKQDIILDDVNMLGNLSVNEKNNGGICETITQLDEINYNEKSIDSCNLTNDKEINSIEDLKKIDEETRISLPNDLLNDNLLLPPLQNQRTSVDELMLSGDVNSANLLDNSASSDEVMNVDQFVNERFKKIIEPDIELSNTSLNLDLPGLDLFQFHTS